MVNDKPNVKDILRRYGSKIEGKIKTTGIAKQNYSKSYTKFKNEMAPDFTRYEKWCHSLGSLIKLNISEKDRNKVKKHIDVAHLDVEPWQALTLGVMGFVSVFLLGLLISVSVILIKNSE